MEKYTAKRVVMALLTLLVDVYKRQASWTRSSIAATWGCFPPPSPGRSWISPGCTSAVSYTHLDVYKRQDEALSCIPFYQDRMVLIAPVNEHFLRLKERREIALEELLREPMILREEGSGSKKSADRFLERMGVKEGQLQITARINDQEAVKNLVAQGLGVSIISERAARNFCEEKRELLFELPEAAARRSLYLLPHKSCV